LGQQLIICANEVREHCWVQAEACEPVQAEMIQLEPKDQTETNLGLPLSLMFPNIWDFTHALSVLQASQARDTSSNMKLQPALYS